MIYLVTHGKREGGPNPRMTADGLFQIERLRELLPKNTPLVVVGTGKRFLQVYGVLQPSLNGAKVEYSPFCGSADGMEPDGKTIPMASGELTEHDSYLGLVRCKAFDAWKFLKDLPNGTLLCSGGELMMALGLEGVNEKGQLFELDPATQTGRKIS